MFEFLNEKSFENNKNKIIPPQLQYQQQQQQQYQNRCKWSKKWFFFVCFVKLKWNSNEKKICLIKKELQNLAQVYTQQVCNIIVIIVKLCHPYKWKAMCDAQANARDDRSFDASLHFFFVSLINICCVLLSTFFFCSCRFALAVFDDIFFISRLLLHIVYLFLCAVFLNLINILLNLWRKNVKSSRSRKKNVIGNTNP